MIDLFGCGLKRFMFHTFSYLFIQYLPPKNLNAVTSGNFMVEVKNKTSSFRLLALFPPCIRASCSGLSDSAVQLRRKEITHEGISAILNRLEGVLNTPFDFLCADGKYRRLVPMLHFLNLDGQEISMHSMCNTFNCPVCSVPRSELGNPDIDIQLRNSQEVFPCILCLRSVAFASIQVFMFYENV